MKSFKKLVALLGCALLLTSCGYKESTYADFKTAAGNITSATPSKLEVKGKLYNEDYEFTYDATNSAAILKLSIAELAVFSFATSSQVGIAALIEDSSMQYYLKDNGFKTVKVTGEAKETHEWNSYGYLTSYVNTDNTNPSDISFSWTFAETK